jgi:hypothetical protein
MCQKLCFLLLLASSIGCKKNIDFPPDIRPNEFWAQYTLIDETGAEKSYAYRGEDTVTLNILDGYVVSLGYFSNYGIRDSIKHIDAGLSEFLAGTPITVRLNMPGLLTDPYSVPEWTEEELEALVFPGKTFVFGECPGEAKITLRDYPNKTWTCTSKNSSNNQGYFRVEEVTDYGAPEIGVPYFGKKVKISFSATLQHSSGAIWTLKNGEAVLFFQFYKF